MSNFFLSRFRHRHVQIQSARLVLVNRCLNRNAQLRPRLVARRVLVHFSRQVLKTEQRVPVAGPNAERVVSTTSMIANHNVQTL